MKGFPWEQIIPELHTMASCILSRDTSSRPTPDILMTWDEPLVPYQQTHHLVAGLGLSAALSKLHISSQQIMAPGAHLYRVLFISEYYGLDLKISTVLSILLGHLFLSSLKASCKLHGVYICFMFNISNRDSKVCGMKRAI